MLLPQLVAASAFSRAGVAICRMSPGTYMHAQAGEADLETARDG